MSAMSEAENDRGPAPRNSFEGRQGPGTYGEKTGLRSSAVGHDGHYKDHYKPSATPSLYGEYDDMSIDPQEPHRRRRSHSPAGRVGHEDRDRYDTREGLPGPLLPRPNPQSQVLTAFEARDPRVETRREFQMDDRVANRGDSPKIGRSDETYRPRSDRDPRRAVGDRVPIYSSRTNDYFLPGEGIGREVIQADICRYLGNDAVVRPYHHHDGRNGYLIRAYRAPTSAMIAELKEASRKAELEQEKRRRGRTD